MEEKSINTFRKRVVVGPEHRVRLDLDIPPDFPEGEAEATVRLTSSSHRPGENRLREIRGKGQGRFWMSDDFDEPLEDFAEYL